MFTLLVTLIAIALGAYVLSSTAFLGGDAYTDGTVKAQASSIVNEATQINSSIDLYKVTEGNTTAVVADLDALAAGGLYLKSTPSTMVGGWTTDGSVVTSAADTVSTEVCAEIATAKYSATGVTCATDVVSFTPNF